MTFKWIFYFELAKTLKEEAMAETNIQLQEAKYRCAISRAYYCAFKSVKNYLMSRFSFDDKSTTSHDDVILACQKDQDRNIKKIGILLKDLKKKRVSADYDEIYLQNCNLGKECEYTLVRTNSVVEFIRSKMQI